MPPDETWSLTSPPSSADAFAMLSPVMAPGQLNRIVGGLEASLLGASREEAVAVVGASELRLSLLASALVVRRDVGRINDLVHALAIALTLEATMIAGERIVRTPSLAAGNNAAEQNFDLETTHRAAEFKLSVWTGHDSQRARGLFSDLVNLAVHTPDGLTPELYVVGLRPGRWLTGTRSTVDWALNGASHSTVASFSSLGAPRDLSIPEFCAAFAGKVKVINLAAMIDGLDSLLT